MEHDDKPNTPSAVALLREARKAFFATCECTHGNFCNRCRETVQLSGRITDFLAANQGENQ